MTASTSTTRLDRAVTSPLGHLASAAAVCVAATTPAFAMLGDATRDRSTPVLTLALALAVARGAAHYLDLATRPTSRWWTVARVALAWAVCALPSWIACDRCGGVLDDAVGVSVANVAVVVLGLVGAYLVDLLCAQVRFAADDVHGAAARWLSVHALSLVAVAVIDLALWLVLSTGTVAAPRGP